MKMLFLNSFSASLTIGFSICSGVLAVPVVQPDAVCTKSTIQTGKPASDFSANEH